MNAWRIRVAVFTALAMGAAACGSLLGDFPDGRVVDGPDGNPASSSDASSTPDGQGMPAGAPEGAICFIPNAVILDMAVDSNDIFWLRASSSGGAQALSARARTQDAGVDAASVKEFAVEACSKRGSDVRPIAILQNQPESLALSDKYVFWSVNQGPPTAHGVWHSDKQGGWNETEPFVKTDVPGPITFANGVLYTGTHNGLVLMNGVEVPYSGFWAGLGDMTSMAASSRDLYWSKRETSELWMKPHSSPSGSVIGGRFLAPPSFLAYDDGTLYWAAPGGGGITIDSNGADGGAPMVLLTQPDFAAFAVHNGEIYWTANENTSGVLRRCTGASCSEKVEMWRASVELSRVALDERNVYLVAKRGSDAFIVKRPR